MTSQYAHGGDIYSHPGAVDFSASLNPLGMPEAAQRALQDCARFCEAYPDPLCRDLRKAVAAYEGVDSESVLCCAGATDALSRTCEALRPKRALVLAPCYSGYEQALSKVDAMIGRFHLKEAEGFAVTEELIGTARGFDALFIANPNNPTGAIVDRQLLERLVGSCHAAGTTVVLDECFRAFTGELGMAHELERFPNLVIVSALTKTHALAGLRVGYLMSSDARFLADAAEAGQEWAVSTPAQMTGVAALEDETYLARTHDYVESERTRLAQGLAAHGMRVIPSQANYLLFQSPKPLYEPLLERGILVRNCANFEGLDPTWHRIAVRTRDENDTLLAALLDLKRN